MEQQVQQGSIEFEAPPPEYPEADEATSIGSEPSDADSARSSTMVKETTVVSFTDLELQQLRGVFVAWDSDGDGFLTYTELQEALRGLGFVPNDELMRKYYLERAKRDPDTLPHPSLAKSKGQKRRSLSRFKIDLTSFMAAAMHLDSAQTTYDEMAPLWTDSDLSGNGEIRIDELKRLLSKVAAPTSLTAHELGELFEAAELLQGKEGSESVRYQDLVESMFFSP